MVSGVDINVQALGTLAQAASNTAGNIANVSTNGYQPVQTTFESGPAYINAVAGRSQAFGQNASGVHEDSASANSRASDLTQAGSNVDIAHEMVDLISYQRAFQANVKVIRSSEETMGTVLDLIA